MNTTPVALGELRERLSDATRQLAVGAPEALEKLAALAAQSPRWLRSHLSLQHSIPSPSNVTRCRYYLWCLAKELARDDTIPESWFHSAAVGILQEPYWLVLFSLAGFEVKLPEKPFELTLDGESLMKAHPDGLLRLGDGEWFTLEQKRLTGWEYKRRMEEAPLSLSKPEHYAQLQLYEHAAGTPWGLYLAAPADHSMLQGMMRNSKAYGQGYDLPSYYLEWVPVDPAEVAHQLGRAKLISDDLRAESPPHREYNAITHSPDGKRKLWPCGFCVHWNACVDQWGPSGSENQWRG